MDVEGGNNLIYLPLDQIIKQRSMVSNKNNANESFSSEKFGLSNQNSGSGSSSREGR